jgi:hypothetical protein
LLSRLWRQGDGSAGGHLQRPHSARAKPQLDPHIAASRAPCPPGCSEPRPQQCQVLAAAFAASLQASAGWQTGKPVRPLSRGCRRWGGSAEHQPVAKPGPEGLWRCGLLIQGRCPKSSKLVGVRVSQQHHADCNPKGKRSLWPLAQEQLHHQPRLVGLCGANAAQVVGGPHDKGHHTQQLQCAVPRAHPGVPPHAQAVRQHTPSALGACLLRQPSRCLWWGHI